MYPGTENIGAIFVVDGASGIWGTYIRYIGAGALAVGGIKDMQMTIVLIAILVLTLLVWLVPAISVSLVGAIREKISTKTARYNIFFCVGM